MSSPECAKARTEPRDSTEEVRRGASEDTTKQSGRAVAFERLLREHAMHEPLPAPIAIKPQLLAARVTADEIIAADVPAVPPAAFDALGTRRKLQRCVRRAGSERVRLGKKPQGPNQQSGKIVLRPRNRSHRDLLPSPCAF